jgi:signal transduction histidine kinase
MRIGGNRGTVSIVGKIRRERHVRETRLDAATALVVGIIEVVGTNILAASIDPARALDPIGYALLVATAAPIAIRNRRPLLALVAITGTATAYTWLGYPNGFQTIAVALGIWAAVAAGHRAAAAAASVVFLANLVPPGAVVDIGNAETGMTPSWLIAPFWVVWWIFAAFVLGEVSRSRRSYLEQVEQRAIDAEQTREEMARRRAGEERIRIARELHDLLAHNMSMINVRSGVALHLIDRQPEQARDALTAIHEASREALRELRATLGVLRGVNEADPLEPAPGLSRLPDLVERARSTGLAIEVETAGEARPLPAGTDLAVYRIIQESLTNVTRHAGEAAHVAISIQHGTQDIGIMVQDDGQGLPPGVQLRPGNGLTGMRERAVAAGGELQAGPRPGGGFAVRARFPTGGAP